MAKTWGQRMNDQAKAGKRRERERLQRRRRARAFAIRHPLTALKRRILW